MNYSIIYRYQISFNISSFLRFVPRVQRFKVSRFQDSSDSKNLGMISISCFLVEIDPYRRFSRTYQTARRDFRQATVPISSTCYIPQLKHQNFENPSFRKYDFPKKEWTRLRLLQQFCIFQFTNKGSHGSPKSRNHENQCFWGFNP